MSVKDTISRCGQCNGVVLEDDTVVNCTGECGRDIATEDTYVPLNFHDDNVVRELQDFDDVVLEELDYED